MRASALPGLLLLAFVAAVSASVACSNQAEGDFCDTANGNNDCQDGLECQAPAPGITTGANRDRCCPIPPAQPTTSACALNTSTVIDASTEVSETSAPDTDAGAGNAPEAGAAPTPDAGHADALPE